MKIDTTNIEDFENLTPEEKIQALLELDVPDKVDLTKFVSKDIFDKTASELANAKKTLKENLSIEQQQKAEREQEYREKDELIALLLQEKREADYTGRLLELGMDKDTATKAAKELPEGITDSFFEGLLKFTSDFEKSIRAEVTRSTPQPKQSGIGTTYQTKEEIMKIKDFTERQKAISENIELFK